MSTRRDRGAVSPGSYLRRRYLAIGTGLVGLLLGAVIIYAGVPDGVDMAIAIGLFILGTVTGLRIGRISDDLGELGRGGSNRDDATER